MNQPGEGRIPRFPPRFRASISGQRLAIAGFGLILRYQRLASVTSDNTNVWTNVTIFPSILPCELILLLRVLEIPTDEDLADFSRFLWERRLRHRIFEESGVQIVEVASAEHAPEVRHQYNEWCAGRIVVEPEPVLPPRRVVVANWFRPNPAVAVLVLLLVACFPLTAGLAAPNGLVHWFTFSLAPQALIPSEPWQLWRWFTPALLHFGIVHLAFNAALLWELGRRIEGQLGSLSFVILVLVLAGLSNWAQYLWSPGATFGGMSGVDYGLLGFVVTAARLYPSSLPWQLPQGFALSLLGFLVLFSSGITENFGLYIANAAHWGGLLAGVLCAAIWYRLRRVG